MLPALAMHAGRVSGAASRGAGKAELNDAAPILGAAWLEHGCKASTRPQAGGEEETEPGDGASEAMTCP